MLSASATILSTTPGCLSSTALLRQGLRQIRAAGLAPAAVPRHVVNSRPGRIADHQADPGGLRAVRENAMRFWQGQQDPLSLMPPAPSPQRPQAHSQPPRPLYAAPPLPPFRVFAPACSGSRQQPKAAAAPRIVDVERKRHEPRLDLESWLSEQHIVARRKERHPLGLISLHGLPLLERNTSHGSEPWPSRTSTSLVWGSVARAAWDAEAAACALGMAARRRGCPGMDRLVDPLRGLVRKPSARHPHPPHAYPTRPQKSELHPYGIHRAFLRARS